MNDSRVVLELRDEKLNISCERVSLPDLVRMLGYMAGFIVWEAAKSGMTADDIKDKMLDIFLAATADLTDEKAAEAGKDI